MTFDGFQSGRDKLTPIPGAFFSKAMPVIDDLGELKIILYAFWYMNQQQREMQYLTLKDLCSDEILADNFQPEPERRMLEALEKAVAHKLMVSAMPQGDKFYFLNTPQGRAAARAMQQNQLTSPQGVRPVIELQDEPPNLFRLYEENIGPLTPLISDTLQDAENTYPLEWIEDAIQIAVHKNVRNWRYIDAILVKWQKEGRIEKDRRGSQEDRRKYIEGEYGDIIEH